MQADRADQRGVQCRISASDSMMMAHDPVDAMSTILTRVARTLVDHPENVALTLMVEADTTFLMLRVGREDLGKLIGDRGRTVRSMRTVVRAFARKAGSQFELHIQADKQDAREAGASSCKGGA